VPPALAGQEIKAGVRGAVAHRTCDHRACEDLPAPLAMTPAPAPVGGVPASITDVRTPWLAAALGRDHPSASLLGFDAQRIGADFGFASEVHRLRLAGSGLPPAVVIKLWQAQDADGLNEVRFYRDFAPGIGAVLPRCHHAQADAAAGRGVLVLADLSHMVQGDCLDLIARPRACRLAEALARLHVHHWHDHNGQPPEGLPVTPRVDRGDAWHAERRASFLQRFANEMHGAGLRLLSRVESRVALARQRLQAGPSTLLHRDLHLDNVLFDAHSDAPCLIDWASIGWGPPAIDLAAVVFELDDLRHQDIVAAHYLATLQRLRPAVALDAATLRGQLSAALLLRFASATCGVARWQPASARAAAIVSCGIARAARLAAHAGVADPELFAA
jgi:hypothetical protein